MKKSTWELEVIAADDVAVVCWLKLETLEVRKNCFASSFEKLMDNACVYKAKALLI